MAITTQALTAALVGTFKAQGIKGSVSPSLARSISVAFVGWLPTLTASTTHVGLLGSGTGNGKAALASSQGVALVTQALTSLKMNGASAKSLGVAVAQAIAAIVNSSSTVQVTIAGTATGSGIGGLTSVSAQSLTQRMVSAMQANGIRGAQKNTLARSLSKGIADFMKTASIQTIDVGTPVQPPAPGTGSGTGTIS